MIKVSGRRLSVDQKTESSAFLWRGNEQSAEPIRIADSSLSVREEGQLG